MQARTGFIGSKIVEMLSEDHEITVVDNNDTYGLMPAHELEKLMQWRSSGWNKKNVLEAGVVMAISLEPSGSM